MRDGIVAGFYFLDRDGNTHVYRNHIGQTPDEEDLLQHLFGHQYTRCERFAPLLAAPDAHPPIKVMTFEDPAQSGRDLVVTLEQAFAAWALDHAHAHLACRGHGARRRQGQRAAAGCAKYWASIRNA